jgi:hypothetical protein
MAVGWPISRASLEVSMSLRGKSATTAPARTAVRAGPNAPLASIALRSGGKVAVGVVSRGGQAVEGASVEILDGKGENVVEDLIAPEIAFGPMATGADGKLTFGPFAPGVYRVAVRKGVVRSAETRVVVEKSGTAEVVLKLPD